MMLLAMLDPSTARIAIPVALAVAYACYHVWRWRAEHPKVAADDLPVSASSDAVRAKPEGEKADGQDAARATCPAAPAKPEDVPSAADEPAQQHPPHGDVRLDAGESEAVKREYAGERERSEHPGHFVRLGEAAWNRGALVEAHFWISMARLHGGHGLSEWLHDIRMQWVDEGCPQELENDYADFPFERGELARAWMKLSCGFDRRVNYDRIVYMANAGNADAKIIVAAL